jgi:hypothetical protein
LSDWSEGVPEFDLGVAARSGTYRKARRSKPRAASLTISIPDIHPTTSTGVALCKKC